MCLCVCAAVAYIYKEDMVFVSILIIDGPDDKSSQRERFRATQPLILPHSSCMGCLCVDVCIL